MLGLVSSWWESRTARYQADALRAVADARKAEAEAERHRVRRELLGKQYHTPADVAMLSVLEDARSAELFEGMTETTSSSARLYPAFPLDPRTIWKDYIRQFQDFSRGGWGYGGQATDKTGRLSGADYPFFWDEQSLGLLRSMGRLVVGTNPNAAGLLGGMRRYVFGTGATVRVRPKSPQHAATAKEAQAYLDAFRKKNRMAFREREGFTRAARDGEAVFLLGYESGVPWVRYVWPEQIRRPHDRSDEDYSFGRRCEPDDVETTLAWAIHSLEPEHTDWEEVPAEAIVYLSHNLDSGVKRGKPDFCLGVADNLDAADRLGSAMGAGSIVQAKIAYIREHPTAPQQGVRDFPPETATHQKYDAFGNVIDVKKFHDGTIIDTKDSKFTPGPYSAGISGHLDVFQMLNRRAQSWYNAPEWLGTSYSQEVNFASSLTAESPLVMTGTELQAIHADCHRDLHERVLAIGAAEGHLPRNVLELVDVDVTLPSMVVRDKDKEANTGRTQLEIGATSPQKLCEEAGNEWEQIQKDRQAVGLGPVGSQPQPPAMPGAGPELSPPDAPDNSAPFDLDVAAEALQEALQEAGFTGTIKDKAGRERHYVNGRQVKGKGEVEAAGGKQAGGRGARKQLDKETTAAATEHLRKAAAAEASGDKETAKQFRVAGTLLNTAAGHHAAGDHAAAEEFKRIAAEYAEGVRVVGQKGKGGDQGAAPGSVDRTNPDLDAFMAEPARAAKAPVAAADLRKNTALDAAFGADDPAVARGHAWAAKQADAHSAKVAEHLGLKGPAARSTLNRAIRSAVEKAIASGSGSVVITGKGGKKIRVTVRRKVKEAEGSDDGWEIEVIEADGTSITSIDPPDYLLEADEDGEGWLVEAGFTGTIKDSLGRERHYVNGKQVAGRTDVEAKKPAANWVPSQKAVDGGDVAVEVDVAKLDAGWQKDAGYYVPPGGGGDKAKYENARKFLASAPSVHAPEVTIDPDGTISFTDGRHRAAAARDEGHGTIVVTVPKEQAGRLRAAAGAGKDAPTRELPADAPKPEHVWSDIEANLTIEVKSDPDKVKRLKGYASHAYNTVMNLALQWGPKLAPDILDVAEDFESIKYAKNIGTGAAHDPFAQHLGVPYSAVSVAVSRTLAAAITYFRKGKRVTEAVSEALAGLGDEERRQIAEQVAELFRQLWADIPGAPVPTVDDILAHMAGGT